MDRLTINIKGMSCNHCKMAVEQHFKLYKV